MARIARVIAVGYPHHISERGNRRQRIVFCDEDYLAYIGLMAQQVHKDDVAIWAWCLMLNHVYLIAVPQSKEGPGHAIGEAHRRYTRRIHFREIGVATYGRKDLLLFPWMNNTCWPHGHTARSIVMNPVAAKLVH